MIVSKSVIIVQKHNHAWQIDITISLRQVFLCFVVNQLSLPRKSRLLAQQRRLKIKRILLFIHQSIASRSRCRAFDKLKETRSRRDEEKKWMRRTEVISGNKIWISFATESVDGSFILNYTSVFYCRRLVFLWGILGTNGIVGWQWGWLREKNGESWCIEGDRIVVSLFICKLVSQSFGSFFVLMTVCMWVCLSVCLWIS
jgi:hypothetical protein